MSEIRHWLERHGLGKYADVLVENDVDLDVLPHLTEAHLEKLGVSLGHRVRMLEAIRSLDAQPPAPGAQAESDDGAHACAGEAERRQLTIMFADLVGSTELSRNLDPEELRDSVLAYQDAAKATIERYGGYVTRYMGDGVRAMELPSGAVRAPASRCPTSWHCSPKFSIRTAGRNRLCRFSTKRSTSSGGLLTAV